MARPRILFVDDEPNIRLTLPAVLHMHGFDVHSVGTVADALAAMQDARYDVLIADLNIGQPGDGFTVVSAMRRTQTHAVTIILTGYPAFETALKAIREQVDDYVVKPAQVESLVRMIHDHLANNNRHEPVPGRRVALILKENQKSVIDRWLSLVKEDPDLRELPLTDRERADHLPGVLSGMVDMLTSHPGETSLQAMQDAAKHGRERRRQGYTLPMLCSEARILRHAIFTVVQEHLLAVDISYLLADIIQIGDTLDAQLRVAVESYLANGAEPKAA